MDTNNSYQANITGNNNQIFQNISGVGAEKASDERRKKVIESIQGLITHFQSIDLKEDEIPDVLQIEDASFGGVDFEEIVNAVQQERCVLFLGPEISVDEHGVSLHEKFNRSISNHNRQYYKKEGFFMPGSESKVFMAAKIFYENEFFQQNKIGYELLLKLAQIPFKFIISLAPDETICQVYDQYHIDHEFAYYNEQEQPKKISLDKPFIYNALGSIIRSRYIYTHKAFNQYVKSTPETKFSFGLEAEINKQDIVNYLFIGFDFNKWYNRLLMYELNLFSGVTTYSFNADGLNKWGKDFLKRQFNVTFIDENCAIFVDLLLNQFQKRNAHRPLMKHLVKTIGSKLEQLEIKAMDAETQAELHEIEGKINKIKTQYNIA